MTIGAAPRPDLTDDLRMALEGAADVVEYGALDDLAPDETPPTAGSAGRPLVTRRADGRVVVADEGWLTPRIAALVARAEAEDADAIVLLCAGGFDAVTARVPLIRPRDAAVARLRGMGARRIAVLVPIEAQVEPAARAWSAAGFEAVVATGSPADAAQSRTVPPSDAVVLDFVGYPRSDVTAAATALDPVPLVDLSAAMVDAVVATIRR